MASPRIKFCGITSLSDARLAVEAGAWALGTILWPGSERHCDPAEAARIAGELRRQAEIAGVFVNQPLDEVIGLADGIGLSLVQLHGDEGPSFCAEVARRTGAKVIKAARIRAGSDVQAMEAFHTDFHLLDTHRAGLYGGTGETFDWELVRLRRTSVPLILSRRADARERRRRDRRRPSVRRRRRQRHRGLAGREGPGEAARVRRGGPRRRGGGVTAGWGGSSVPHRFGPYGGRYVPETLMPALDELEQAWVAGARRTPASTASSSGLLRDYVGRPDAAVPARGA